MPERHDLRAQRLKHPDRLGLRAHGHVELLARCDAIARAGRTDRADDAGEQPHRALRVCIDPAREAFGLGPRGHHESRSLFALAR